MCYPMSVTKEMTSVEERNKTLIRSFIDEIFNEYNLSSIEKYFGKGSVEGSPQAGKEGEGFKQFLTDFFIAFPDWRANIEHIIAENNLVVVFLNGTGTHKGEFRGVLPTNNIRSADLYRVENDIITGHWDVVDQLNLLKQTGALLSEDVNKEFNDAKVVWIHDYEESEVR
jgi:predicted SnoaL-like aldol condensation-catalyzing enzyme